MRLIVDRIEGDYLVCETDDLEIVNIELRIVPEAKEKDIIDIKVIKNDNKEIEKLVETVFE